MTIVEKKNAINFFTRNKHSDYQEVVFSSILSNLLDPDLEIVFKDELIKYIYEKYFGTDNFKKGHLKSEEPLDNAGNIDILYKTEDTVFGIEVKIWDRSAKNVNSEGTDQLVRYADKLSKITNEWKLLFVVPTNLSRKCFQEFRKARTTYPKNVYMLPWNIDQTESSDIGIDDINVSDESLLDILKKLKDLVIDEPISKWIFYSLLDIIPKLKILIPDSVKFPYEFELQTNKDLYPIFKTLFDKYQRWPSPLHSTVGIPYGKEINKSSFHKNSLFRIRTTKDYYEKEKDKIKNLPKDYVELELWPDVVKQVEIELKQLINNYNIELLPNKHIGPKKEKIILLKLPSNIAIDNFIKEFDPLIRKGFKRAENNLLMNKQNLT